MRRVGGNQRGASTEDDCEPATAGLEGPSFGLPRRLGTLLPAVARRSEPF
jgi:hypothetical protein